MRNSNEKQRRKAGTVKRAQRAISKDAQRACGLKNGINALLMRFIRQIEIANWAAETSQSPLDALLAAEAAEDAAVLLEQDRILARGGVRWDREGFDGSTAPARSLISGPVHIAREWIRADRNRWNWGDGDALALVRVEKDLWELRHFHAAGPQTDLDTKNKFSGRLLSPGLDLATLRRVVTDWLETSGSDPASWSQIPQIGSTAILCDNNQQTKRAKTCQT